MLRLDDHWVNDTKNVPDNDKVVGRIVRGKDGRFLSFGAMGLLFTHTSVDDTYRAVCMDYADSKRVIRAGPPDA
jgi:hypothetical protein